MVTILLQVIFVVYVLLAFFGRRQPQDGSQPRSLEDYDDALPPVKLVASTTLHDVFPFTQAIQPEKLVYTGRKIGSSDVLNATFCYCSGQGDNSQRRDVIEESNEAWGYYYLFEYWDLTWKQKYSLEWKCSVNEAGNRNTKPENYCLGRMRNDNLCREYGTEDEFCIALEIRPYGETRLQMDSMIHGRPKKYSLPADGGFKLQRAEEMDNCEHYCKKKFTGMSVSKPESRTAFAKKHRIKPQVITYLLG